MSRAFNTANNLIPERKHDSPVLSPTPSFSFRPTQQVPPGLEACIFEYYTSRAFLSRSRLPRLNPPASISAIYFRGRRTRPSVNPRCVFAGASTRERIKFSWQFVGNSLGNIHGRVSAVSISCRLSLWIVGALACARARERERDRSFYFAAGESTFSLISPGEDCMTNGAANWTDG